ncbi:S1 RNA-binding domain-containing protein [Anaeromicropila herbilytica]|nr:S1 RNA-binding domain-containing protein [Anaeromicropila herbilytica]
MVRIMTNESNTTNDILNEDVTEVSSLPEENQEVVPSMDDFKDELNRSFKKIDEGDIVKGKVIGISDAEVTIDLSYYAEGIIPIAELSNDPHFSIKGDVTLGEEISALVLRTDDGEGNILLSRKKADDILAWDSLKAVMEAKDHRKVKVAQAVNGGVVTYLNGIRAFIPASQLSLSYVEDLESFVGKTLEVVIITVDESAKKLVLSAKEVEKEKAIDDKNSKISKLQLGLVTTGVVEKIAPYGAFVTIGDGLSGLVHISQICGKRIKSPSEVLKEGEEVTVKIIDIKDGKVSLSIKAVEDKEDVLDDVEEAPMEYSSDGDAATGLASLLANIKL